MSKSRKEEIDKDRKEVFKCLMKSCLIITRTREHCRKFISKVDTGKARSVETYAECKMLLKEIDVLEKMLGVENE